MIPTKAKAILIAETTGFRMIVYYWEGYYRLIHYNPNIEKLIKLTGSFVYKTQTEEHRTLLYDEGNRHVREEIVDADGRLVSRRSYVKPKAPVVERDRKKAGIPVRPGRQNHRSGSF